MSRRIFYLSLALAFMMSTATLQAGELVHSFVDPSFGGSPFNGAYVLGVASAQDQTKDPNAVNYSAGFSPFNSTTQSFADLIQQSLQQQLAAKIVGNLIGNSTTALTPGTYSIGSNQVTVGSNGSGGTVVTIVDPSGKTTQIQMPQY